MTDDPVSDIRNLGPRSVEMFAKADIHTASELRALGADEAYRRLLSAGTRPHFIGYYAMVMGLQGRPWNDLDAAEKTALRARFDALVGETRSSKANADAEIERALDRIGVGRQDSR